MLQETMIPQVHISSFWGYLVYWFRGKKLTVLEDTQTSALHSESYLQTSILIIREMASHF